MTASTWSSTDARLWAVDPGKGLLEALEALCALINSCYATHLGDSMEHAHVLGTPIAAANYPDVQDRPLLPRCLRLAGGVDRIVQRRC